jgi:hypothetical protein
MPKKISYHAQLICAVATALGQPPDEPIYTGAELRATFPAETNAYAINVADLRKLLRNYGEKPKVEGVPGPEWWPKAMRDRDYQIVEYLETVPGGATFREAGNKFGISRTTVGEARRRVMADRAASKTDD